MPMRWSNLTGKLTRSEEARSKEDWRPAELLPHTAAPGFAEAMSRTALGIAEAERMAAPPPIEYAEVEFASTPPDDLPRAPEPVFASLGPHGHRERMRDRLLDRGPDGLADYELLEMLLFLVQAKGDTKPLAKKLVNVFGSYANVLSATQADLLAVAGVGRFTVAALKLVHGSAVRLARAEVLDQPILGNWDQLMAYLNAVMARERVEQFRILFLDTKNRLVADELQGRGTINHTPVYVREVARRALELHAASVILMHNHPSGDPHPSANDVAMTRQVADAARTMSIVVHDHVIVGNGRWFSFRAEGLLAP